MKLTCASFVTKGKCKGYLTSAIQCASILNGPIIACSCASFISLVPVANVMKEPEYWYQEEMFRFLAVVPLGIAQFLVTAYYWSEFSFEQKWESTALLGGLGCFVYIITVISYYFIWTYGLGFSLPMPFGYLISGSTGTIALSIGIWIR